VPTCGHGSRVSGPHALRPVHSSAGPCDARSVQRRQIGDDESLTQCGRASRGFPWMLRNFRDPPETYMSLLLGKRDPKDAVETAFDRTFDPSEDTARSTTAGALRQAGFRVEHKPTRRIEPHVAVYWDHGPWDHAVGERFAHCFKP
jgi:hypothetical protein